MKNEKWKKKNEKWKMKKEKRKKKKAMNHQWKYKKQINDETDGSMYKTIQMQSKQLTRGEDAMGSWPYHHYTQNQRQRMPRFWWNVRRGDHAQENWANGLQADNTPHNLKRSFKIGILQRTSAITHPASLQTRDHEVRIAHAPAEEGTCIGIQKNGL